MAKNKDDNGKVPLIFSYFDHLEKWQAEIASTLHNLVIETLPEVTAGMEGSHPVYDFGGPLVFIEADKNHVVFGFWRGADLDAPKGLLEGTGVRLRHIKLSDKDGIKKELLRKLILQAAELNKAGKLDKK